MQTGLSSNGRFNGRKLNKQGDDEGNRHPPEDAALDPEVQEDEASFRLRQVQGLLRKQFEFEARYPEAFEILFPYAARNRERVGLSLPSFGVRILNNDPGSNVSNQDWYSGGDAYSSTHDHKVDQGSSHVERGLWPVHQGDLQGILLAILGREEYAERIEKFAWQSELFEGMEVPEESPVRITDLRLAKDLKPGVLRRGLKPVLELLETPITAESVALWKHRVLGSDLNGLDVESKRMLKLMQGAYKEELPEYMAQAVKQAANVSNEEFEQIQTQTELLEQQFGDKDVGTASVSFAAAALLLFLDLDMPGVSGATPYRLTEQIESLAEIVRKLTRGLNQATKELDDLTANRTAGRQPGLAGGDYMALMHYRMGYELEEIAEGLGITPYSSKTGEGSRDWKTKVKRRLAKGKKVEEERYPRAAAIFANRDNPHVRSKAISAYSTYARELVRNQGRLHWRRLSTAIRTGNPYTQRGLEIIEAYVQLGSCLVQGIPLLPE